MMRLALLSLFVFFTACSESPGPAGDRGDARTERMEIADAALDEGARDRGALDEGSEAELGASADQGLPGNIVFASSFSGVQVCDEDGECATSPHAESYYECSDTAVHLRGEDSRTGFRWPTRGADHGDMPGDAQRNYFNDVIVDGEPDCCASGCTATQLSECHELDTIATTQHDGVTGDVLMLKPLKDCSTASYSRLQYVMFPSTEAAPEGHEDFSAFYFEVWLRFPNLSAALAEPGAWSCIVELYMGSGWKLTVVIWHGPDGRPIIGMKNGSKSNAYRDNDITPEDDTWFKLRVWYKGGESDGHWRSTYTCPDCSPPVRETVIKEWKGKTREGAETPQAITPLKTTRKGLEMHADDFAFGRYEAPL